MQENGGFFGGSRHKSEDGPPSASSVLRGVLRGLPAAVFAPGAAAAGRVLFQLLRLLLVALLYLLLSSLVCILARQVLMFLLLLLLSF